MLLLLGIVKKNSILQVDYANVLRARGLPIREAIVESCRTRLRPILMTTTAIIAGLVPTSLGIGIGGTGRAAIAVTIIGGQALCLFLTLLLVPVAYVKFDALEQAVVGERRKTWLGKLSAATVGSSPRSGGQAVTPEVGVRPCLNANRPMTRSVWPPLRSFASTRFRPIIHASRT